MTLSAQLGCVFELMRVQGADPREWQALLATRLTNAETAWTMVFSGHWSTEQGQEYIQNSYVPDDDIPF